VLDALAVGLEDPEHVLVVAVEVIFQRFPTDRALDDLVSVSSLDDDAFPC